MRLSISNAEKSLKIKLQKEFANEFVESDFLNQFSLSTATSSCFNGTYTIENTLVLNDLTEGLRVVLGKNSFIVSSLILDSFIIFYQRFVEGRCSYKEFAIAKEIFEAAMPHCKGFVLFNITNHPLEKYYRRIIHDYYLPVYYINGTEEECLKQFLKVIEDTKSF
jgi:hypothetical protein